jgi:hypothetical protein
VRKQDSDGILLLKQQQQHLPLEQKTKENTVKIGSFQSYK